MKKVISVIAAVIIVFAIVTFGSYEIFLSLQKQSEKPSAKVEKEVPKENKPVQQKDNTDFTVIGDYDFTREEAIYNLMHYMINTKIKSDVIWGTLELTKNRVHILADAVNASSWSDKNQLLEILNRWKNDDFSLAVEDHNYILDKLGGKDGKATGIKK